MHHDVACYSYIVGYYCKFYFQEKQLNEISKNKFPSKTQDHLIQNLVTNTMVSRLLKYKEGMSIYLPVSEVMVMNEHYFFIFEASL